MSRLIKGTMYRFVGIRMGAWTLNRRSPIPWQVLGSPVQQRRKIIAREGQDGWRFPRGKMPIGKYGCTTSESGESLYGEQAWYARAIEHENIL
jgi:hypothetical protein